MTDRDRTRNLLLQMDSGLLRYDPMFRDYLAATLDFEKYRSRYLDRKIRRGLWVVKLSLLVGLFGVLGHRLYGSPSLSVALWPFFIAAGISILPILCDTRKEKLCRYHFESMLHLAVGHAPYPLPCTWQSGMTAECLKKYSESLEWDLEWKLRRRETRTIFVLMAGLFLYLYMTFEFFGGPLIPFWSGCAGCLG